MHVMNPPGLPDALVTRTEDSLVLNGDSAVGNPSWLVP